MTDERPDVTCFYCNQSFRPRGITRHLKACDEREDRIASAKDTNEETQFHMKVTDQRVPGYQLHLEMTGSESMRILDAYLRRIWLECCNHKSQFYVGDSPGQEVRADTVEGAFGHADELTYIYDFGSESRLLIEEMDMRTGPPLTENPVELMARNEPPEYPCVECDRTAERMCWRCTSYFDLSGLFCGIHADEHDCPKEHILDIVNSPRMGICGYTGPADSPF